MRAPCTDTSPICSAGVSAVGPDAEARGRLDHGREPPAVVGGDHAEQTLRRLRQPPHALEEEPLGDARKRQRGRQRLGAGELPGGQRRRELDQRERVAAGLLEQHVADGRRDRAAGAEADQGLCRVRVQAAELELAQPAGLEAPVAALARAEQHHDALGVESPGDEQQRVGRRRVEPLRVVDQAQDRAALRQLGDERQAGGRDQEAVAGAVGEPERALQRAGLRGRQALEQVQRGTQQLVQPRERQLGLRLDSARREHVHVGRAIAHVLEQGGLADSRLSPQHERAAARRPRGIEQCADEGALRVPSVQHEPILRFRAARI